MSFESDSGAFAALDALFNTVSATMGEMVSHETTEYSRGARDVLAMIGADRDRMADRLRDKVIPKVTASCMDCDMEHDFRTGTEANILLAFHCSIYPGHRPMIEDNNGRHRAWVGQKELPDRGVS